MPSIHPVIAIDPKFRGYLPDNGWTLCVGAGVSKGICPEWQDLAHNVVNEAFSISLSASDFSSLVVNSGWSLDSWIQASANEFIAKGKTHNEFNELIETELYSKIRKQSRGLGLEKYLIKVLNFPKNEPKDRVIEVCDFIENAFPNCSLLQVAGALVACSNKGHKPKSILTFNADTLLETYLDLRLRRDHYLGPGPHSHPQYPFVQVTRTSIASGNKIPIIHCHGAITPSYSKHKETRDSRDKLVFLEQEYLAMASNGAAWAETIFLFHAQSTKLAFIGMSMSDPNIRRWMNAITLERSKDKLVYGVTTVSNPDHIWINAKPTITPAQSIYLTSLRHLGIRPAWINSWSDIESGLKNLSAT